MQRRAAAARPAPAAADATLCCLDDACLLNIFRQLTPLPDLFAASAVCKVRDRRAERSGTACAQP
jgi:hypothetical protein